ncbi:hypothetical protein PI124_g10868 [Phytophthora idaei]|nr:hypothetical protein PI125_g12150 [Phytophthora idaei]KAG3150898.1 hypothetical protein PI126_g11245 [Phytophthora idaei]KAG3244362.1 hypothetical protein PI124_g10868 [Phytophthora idaei]
MIVAAAVLTNRVISKLFMTAVDSDVDYGDELFESCPSGRAE